jgi:hypothetical protein
MCFQIRFRAFPHALLHADRVGADLYFAKL